MRENFTVEKCEKISLCKNAKDGIRTRASEEIGALNRRLRPTRPPPLDMSSLNITDSILLHGRACTRHLLPVLAVEEDILRLGVLKF